MLLLLLLIIIIIIIIIIDINIIIAFLIILKWVAFLKLYGLVLGCITLRTQSINKVTIGERKDDILESISASKR